MFDDNCFLTAELVSMVPLRHQEAPPTTAIIVAVTMVSRSRIGRRNQNEGISKDHHSSYNYYIIVAVQKKINISYQPLRTLIMIVWFFIASLLFFLFL